MSAYRDDLEAAQLRGDDLEREVQQLRARNTELEQQRAETARRPRDERAAQLPATSSGAGRLALLLGVWIVAVVCAVGYAAPWAAVLASVVCLVIMALSPSTPTGSEEDHE